MGYNRVIHCLPFPSFFILTFLSLCISSSLCHFIPFSFLSSSTTQHRGAGAVTIEGGRAGTGQHHLCARNLKYVLTFYLSVSASFSRTHALTHKLLFFYSVITFFTLFYTYFLSFCIVCGTLTLLGEDIGTTGQGGLENGKRFPP